MGCFIAFTRKIWNGPLKEECYTTTIQNNVLNLPQDMSLFVVEEIYNNVAVTFYLNWNSTLLLLLLPGYMLIILVFPPDEASIVISYNCHRCIVRTYCSIYIDFQSLMVEVSSDAKDAFLLVAHWYKVITYNFLFHVCQN